MNTNLIMTLSAGVLGLLGMALTFLPGEIASYMDWSDLQPIVLQMMGALYFGFALINWTAKANIIGGIYSKPIALGNFTHFFVGSLALIKWITQHAAIIIISGATVVYIIFAIVFGYILFVHPKSKP